MRDALNPPKHQGHAPALADATGEERKGFSLRHALHLHSPAPTNRGGVRQVQVQGSQGRVFKSFVSFVFKIFSRENLWALVLFLILIALIVFTSDSSPVWIYQGF